MKKQKYPMDFHENRLIFQGGPPSGPSSGPKPEPPKPEKKTDQPEKSAEATSQTPEQLKQAIKDKLTTLRNLISGVLTESSKYTQGLVDAATGFESQLSEIEQTLKSFDITEEKAIEKLKRFEAQLSSLEGEGAKFDKKELSENETHQKSIKEMREKLTKAKTEITAEKVFDAIATGIGVKNIYVREALKSKFDPAKLQISIDTDAAAVEQYLRTAEQSSDNEETNKQLESAQKTLNTLSLDNYKNNQKEFVAKYKEVIPSFEKMLDFIKPYNPNSGKFLDKEKTSCLTELGAEPINEYYMTICFVTDILNEKGLNTTPEQVAEAIHIDNLNGYKDKRVEENYLKILKAVFDNKVELEAAGIKINFDGGTDGTAHILRNKDKTWHQEKAQALGKILALQKAGRLSQTTDAIFTESQLALMQQYIDEVNKPDGNPDKFVRDHQKDFLPGGQIFDAGLALQRAENFKKKITGKEIDVTTDSVDLYLRDDKNRKLERCAGITFRYEEPDSTEVKPSAPAAAAAPQPEKTPPGAPTPVAGTSESAPGVTPGAVPPIPASTLEGTTPETASEIDDKSKEKSEKIVDAKELLSHKKELLAKAKAEFEEKNAKIKDHIGKYLDDRTSPKFRVLACKRLMVIRALQSQSINNLIPIYQTKSDVDKTLGEGFTPMEKNEFFIANGNMPISFSLHNFRTVPSIDSTAPESAEYYSTTLAIAAPLDEVLTLSESARIRSLYAIKEVYLITHDPKYKKYADQYYDDEEKRTLSVVDPLIDSTLKNPALSETTKKDIEDGLRVNMQEVISGFSNLQKSCAVADLNGIHDNSKAFYQRLEEIHKNPKILTQEHFASSPESKTLFDNFMENYKTRTIKLNESCLTKHPKVVSDFKKSYSYVKDTQGYIETSVRQLRQIAASGDVPSASFLGVLQRGAVEAFGDPRRESMRVGQSEGGSFFEYSRPGESPFDKRMTLLSASMNKAYKESAEYADFAGAICGRIISMEGSPDNLFDYLASMFKPVALAAAAVIATIATAGVLAPFAAELAAAGFFAKVAASAFVGGTISTVSSQIGTYLITGRVDDFDDYGKALKMFGKEVGLSAVSGAVPVRGVSAAVDVVLSVTVPEFEKYAKLYFNTATQQYEYHNPEATKTLAKYFADRGLQVKSVGDNGDIIIEVEGKEVTIKKSSASGGESIADGLF